MVVGEDGGTGNAGGIAEGGGHDAHLPCAGHDAAQRGVADFRHHDGVQLLDESAAKRDHFRVEQVAEVGDGEAGVKTGLVEHGRGQFVAGLDGTLTLGGRYREFTERIGKDLERDGIKFDEPGSYSYWDTMDQGGKTFHASSRRGFHVGPYGLYLKPGVTGEIVFDVRTSEGLRFKRVSMPSAAGLGGYCTALRLALPPGGHNWIEVSLDEGRTWTTVFKDVDTYTRKDAYEMTDIAGARNRFLLRFRVQNTGEEILAMDSWVLTVEVESDGGRG